MVGGFAFQNVHGNPLVAWLGLVLYLDLAGKVAVVGRVRLRWQSDFYVALLGVHVLSHILRSEIVGRILCHNVAASRLATIVLMGEVEQILGFIFLLLVVEHVLELLKLRLLDDLAFFLS